MKNEVIIDGIKYVREEQPSELVLVRTYSAGVHVGELVSREGKECVLKNASIIYRWKGANTLNEVSKNGVSKDEYTRISDKVDQVILTEVIAIYPVSEKAKETLQPVWNQ